MILIQITHSYLVSMKKYFSEQIVVVILFAGSVYWEGMDDALTTGEILKNILCVDAPLR